MLSVFGSGGVHFLDGFSFGLLAQVRERRGAGGVPVLCCLSYERCCAQRGLWHLVGK